MQEFKKRFREFDESNKETKDIRPSKYQKRKHIGNKIIFLDFDGVITNGIPNSVDRIALLEAKFPDVEFFETHHYNTIAVEFFDETALQNLQTIIDAFVIKPQIVIISSWRSKNDTPETYQKLFTKYEFSQYIVDILPFKLASGRTSDVYKVEGIQQWIKDNDFKGNFVILDDDDIVSNFSQVFPHHLVNVDAESLLTFQDAKQAIQILNQDNDIKEEITPTPQ